jgi:hypothetical protein
MPVPNREMMPRELCDEIRDWAAGVGYTYAERPAGGEFAVVTVSDPEGGQTQTSVPNAHHGRKLKKNQVRYTVQKLNKNWRG